MKRAPENTSVWEVMSAIAEPVRLRLVRLVERAELSVGEAAAALQLPQSTVSRQLKLLGEVGWVVRRAEGPATMYRVVLDDLPPAARAVWVAVREETHHGAEYEEDMRRLESVLADRMTDSQAFFGRVAGEWDDLRNELFGVGFTSKAMLGLLDPSWTVIDAGCGTGNASELLAPHVRRVIAVDESAKMLGAAKKRLSHFKNVEFVRGELHAIPVAPHSADGAVCVLVLHHLADPAPALASLRRSLKPGGRLLLVDMLKHDREEYRRSMGHKRLGFTGKEVVDALADAGLTDVRIVTLPSEPDAKGPSLFAATGAAGKGASASRPKKH